MAEHRCSGSDSVRRLARGGGRNRPLRGSLDFSGAFNQSVSWAPDGSRLAFAAVVANWDEGYRIFTVRPDGSGLHRLETGGESDLYPVFSPDGTRIAFSSTRGENRDVYLMQADGTGPPIRLTDHPAADGYPTWSPDGSRIAFHSQRDGN